MAQISKTAAGLEQVDDRVTLDEVRSYDFAYRDFDHSSIPFEKEEWPAIILGSSLVGTLMGLLLGYHGIKTIAFDRHRAILAHPRAAGLSFSTVETLRQLGLEERCHGANFRKVNLDAGLIIVDKLYKGIVKQVVQDHDVERDQEITPTKWLWVTQPILEPIMQDVAPKIGFNLEFGKEVVHYEEHDDGVIVIVKDLDTGSFKKYKTQYLVACDGNRSPTRKKEGIKMKGAGILGNGLSIRFRGDLQELLGERAKHGIIYVRGDGIKGGFRQEEQGKGGLLWVNEIDGKTDFPPGSLSDEEVKQRLHQFAGVPDDGTLDVQSYAHWTLASCTADRFQSKGGRVLIAGDAAHIMPPTGALGGNTGCGDARNLAWKLAYVISGKADPSLLRSYDLERRPIDAFVVDQATRRLYNRVKGRTPRLEEEPYYIAELGHRYNEGAIVPAEGDVHDKDVEDPHAPSGTAGSRFPHAWLLTPEGKTISSLDLIKTNFVLIASEDDSPWISAAKSLNFPIDTYELHEKSKPYQDTKGTMKSKAGLGEGEAFFVRPDGYIAWKAAKSASGHRKALQEVIQALLGKQQD
ncbi:hypothetical protein BS50DRAFT_544354 [Corynespora cassiicola Philippines]|uniref:FAD-binding domain-containing protein n=1 Tax=Corynespora cassiicola Philippines TaxID=1448308 RepID=A0A2T2P2Z9_CORCC|nr:hypothetical protein BS50DRAFT_544354 [Corynespora cassiicola Philippines]